MRLKQEQTLKEETEQKYRTAKAELEEERNEFERSLTMVQHDLKENQRKLELEIEQRQKTEAKLTEVESQLQTEVSAHQAARGNSQQLKKQLDELNDWDAAVWNWV